MADNSGGRPPSMAEHEIAMQQQMMSVPPVAGLPGPPPPPPVPPGVGSRMPPSLSIPPPPMPPPAGVPNSVPQPMAPPPPIAPPQVLPPPIAPQGIPPPSLMRPTLPPAGGPPPAPPQMRPTPPIGGLPPGPPQMLPPPGAMPPMAPPQAMPPPIPPRTMVPLQSIPPPGMPAPQQSVAKMPNIPGPPNLPPSASPPNLPPPGPPPTVVTSQAPPSIPTPQPVSAPQNLPPPGPPPITVPSPGTLPQKIAAMPPSASLPTSTPNLATSNSTAQLPTSGASIPPAPQSWSNTSASPTDENDDDPSKSDLMDDDDPDEKLKPSEVILPKALEDVFALKDQRAAQFDGDIFTVEEEKQIIQIPAGVISTEYADADGDSDDEADIQMTDSSLDKQPVLGKLNKNKRKKKRKKQSRKLRLNALSNGEKGYGHDDEKMKENGDYGRKDEDVTIEYVPERITIADLAPMYRQFYRVFEIFKLENKPKPSEADKSGAPNEASTQQKKQDEKAMEEDDDDPEEEKKDDKEKLSKRKLKKLTRLSVAELKQLVNRPDVVEMHDVTARDPKLLVQLKAHRNTVQVPRHWCFKRKYLQGKRGIEKPPFDLPAFIKKTGIMEMRESLQEKDEAKSLKAKMRERARPKMGKIDIDYQKLHDAFFKWQTKPRMTIHGDLYYEGKEFETRLKEKKPGDLSEELRIALGMPVGPNCHKIPPPWLIAQQRYGPPPSYPNLKIPGLNAPIPDGTSFGYHAGGWGKPPVDENGKPLYGDVFGTNIVDMDSGVDEGDIERNTWGELESESEESSEEEEDEGEDLANVPDETGLVTPAEGLVTPSGLTSVPAGMETPDNIELRKRKIEAEMEDNETPVLYQVLPEKRTDRVGMSMMGSTHVYDIGAVKTAALAAAGATRQPPIGDREGMVELALDPSELDMDNEAMAQRYEQQMREQQSHLQKEDLSDMLAEHVARQKSKRKRQQADTTKQTKKYKEFKF